MVKVTRKVLYKTVTWRITSMTIGALVTYGYLGSWQTAGVLAVLHGVVATIAYFFHELAYKYLRARRMV